MRRDGSTELGHDLTPSIERAESRGPRAGSPRRFRLRSQARRRSSGSQESAYSGGKRRALTLSQRTDQSRTAASDCGAPFAVASAPTGGDRPRPHQQPLRLVDNRSPSRASNGPSPSGPAAATNRARERLLNRLRRRIFIARNRRRHTDERGTTTATRTRTPAGTADSYINRPYGLRYIKTSQHVLGFRRWCCRRGRWPD